MCWDYVEDPHWFVAKIVKHGVTSAEKVLSLQIEFLHNVVNNPSEKLINNNMVPQQLKLNLFEQRT